GGGGAHPHSLAARPAFAQRGAVGRDGAWGGAAADRRIRGRGREGMNAPAVQTASAEARKTAAASWFATLRDQLCAAFEAIEDEYRGAPDRPPGRFLRKDWPRPPA